ncbi:hypothetical protein F53441_13415 [Fusarium austroafricanum]|uniref:C2H2-type domain-containing protein n=1 Tax=Fusarium austroafricanum TaxID=2364996 RepID=A0A8H4JRN8_9HYPO|nr:hypothetical protein F53441_13415 [Fusarium austroafricanum]
MSVSTATTKLTTPEHTHSTPEALLNCNADFKLIICIPCQYAIQPQAIERHLEEIHHLPSRLRRPYLKYTSTFQLSERAEVLDACIKEEDFPVAGLQVLDGFQCLEAGCGHLCASTKRMQKHWNEKHGALGHYGLNWQPVPLQTFFRGNLLKYFTHPLLSLEPLFNKQVSDHELEKIFCDWGFHGALSEGDRCLLSYYLQPTYKSLANRHGNTHLWQITIPKCAANNSFLRHGIVALAALHRMVTENSSTFAFEVDANSYWNLATSKFNKTIARPPNTALECYAIIAFIHIHILWSFTTFASGQVKDSDELFLCSDKADMDYMAPWLYYVRHGCQLVCGFWDAIGNGPLGTLARSWEIPILAEDKLSEQFTELFLSIMEDSCEVSEGEKADLHQAARDLALALSAAQALGSDLTVWDAIRLWPLTLSAGFIQQVRNKSPCALLLLGCYCVVLDQLNCHWFATGLSSRLLDGISASMNEEWNDRTVKLRAEIESVFVPNN